MVIPSLTYDAHVKKCIPVKLYDEPAAIKMMMITNIPIAVRSRMHCLETLWPPGLNDQKEDNVIKLIQFNVT